MTTREGLKFSTSNVKLEGSKKKFATFSLPAGHTCPGAAQCRALVSREGKLSEKYRNLSLRYFRCFAASQEVRLKNIRKARWHNFDLIRPMLSSADAMCELICESLPKVDIIRIHVSGDFFNAQYFLAWCKAAQRNPQILFYAYTKSLHIWLANRDSVPSNLVLTASYGGLHDELIKQHDLKSAVVVFSEQEAKDLGLEIDHIDSHAMDASCKSFALLIHNVQPAGSEASKAMVALKGKGSYSHDQSINEKRAQQVDSALAA